MNSMDFIRAGLVAANEFHVRTDAILWLVPGDRDLSDTYHCAMEDPNCSKVDETVTLTKWTNGEIAFHIGYAPRANMLIVRKSEPL